MSALRILSLALAMPIAWALGCQGEEARLGEHLSRGEAYLAENKPAEAVIEYKNALQINPNLAQAHWGLAQAHLAAGEARKAYWELQETVRLDPANVQARMRYGGFLLLGKQEQLEQALVQADEALAVEPDHAEAYALRGRALEQLQRPEEALAAYEKAVELESENAGLLRVLAGFHARRGDRKTAEPLLRRLSETEPNFRSYAELASFLARDREREELAEAAYQEALTRAEEHEQALGHQLLASFYYARERYDEAEQVLQAGLTARENDLDLIYALARFYQARGETAQADEMVEQATRARPNETQPFLILSAHRARSGDLEGALAAAEAAVRIDPRDEASRLRKAELLVDLGTRGPSPERLAEGRAIVDAVLAAEPASPEAHFVKAKLELGNERLDDAAAALRRALDARPDWAQAHLLLGSTLSLQGDLQGARAEALRALELDAQLLEARRLLGRVHASLGEHEFALEQGRKILGQVPDDVSARILVAQSLAYLGKPVAALVELEAIPSARRNADAHFALGRLQLLQGDLAAARQELLLALEERPHHAAILESLLEVDRRAGRLEGFLQRISRAVAAEPRNPRLYQLQGSALLSAGEPERGEASLRRAVEIDPNDLGSHQALARYYVATGRLEAALSTYREALKSRPDSGSLHLTVGSLYELSGQRDRAVDHYEQALRLDPNLAVAKNNLAYLLADHGGDLTRALDLAQEAKALLPETASVADTLGWVLYKKGMPQAAIGYLQEAEGGFAPERLELGIVRHHLALAYEANGEPSKARAVLERALAAFEAKHGASREAGQSAPPEPAWVGDIRAMLERLRAGASDAPAES